VKFTYSFLASQYQEEWPLFDGILYFSAYLEKYSSLKVSAFYWKLLIDNSGGTKGVAGGGHGHPRKIRNY
jgi:hypothetical protein